MVVFKVPIEVFHPVQKGVDSIWVVLLSSVEEKWCQKCFTTITRARKNGFLSPSKIRIAY